MEWKIFLTNRFDKIDEFLIHIATIALSNQNLDITTNFVYGQLLTYGIDEEKNIKSDFKLFIENFKYKKNIYVYKESNWDYFCQFVNRKEEFTGKKAIKIFIPQDKKHIIKSALKIFNFLEENNIAHISKVASR